MGTHSHLKFTDALDASPPRPVPGTPDHFGADEVESSYVVDAEYDGGNALQPMHSTWGLMHCVPL